MKTMQSGRHRSNPALLATANAARASLGLSRPQPRRVSLDADPDVLRYRAEKKAAKPRLAAAKKVAMREAEKALKKHEAERAQYQKGGRPKKGSKGLASSVRSRLRHDPADALVLALRPAWEVV